MPGIQLRAIRYRYKDISQHAASVWKIEGPVSFFRRSAKRLLQLFRPKPRPDPQAQYQIEALLKNPFFDFSGIKLHSRLQPDPLVSIVVPIYNGIGFVPGCIRSLYQAPVGVRFEVILVDNGSTDGVLPILRQLVQQYPDLTLIENVTNVGFAQGINQGAAQARGEFLVIGNSDMMATPAWLDRLVDAFRQEPALAVVSPVTNYVGEGPQLDLAAQNVTAENFQQYAQQVAVRTGFYYVPDRLVFFCVMLRKQVFDHLGGMTSAFGLGNYEDDDFCLRARMAGYKLAVVPGCFMYHYGSRTFAEQKIDHVQWMLKNEKIFYDRVARFSIQAPLPRQTPGHITHSPRISVIVRTKDRPYLLKQAFNSLANQSLRDFEVVVINDGGADIAPLLGEFDGLLKFTYLDFQAPIGRAAALNAGLNKAHGQWITYLDDDDIVYPLHLEMLHHAATLQAENPIAYTDANKSLCWAESSQKDLVVIDRIRFANKPFSLDEMLIDNWIPIMSFMHHIKLIDEAGNYEEDLELFEDWDFLIRLANRYHFQHFSRPSCEYRFRFGAQFDDSTLQKRENALKYRSTIYEKYPAQNQDTAIKRSDTLVAVAQQIEDVRRIATLQLNNIQKSFLITARLGGFPLPEALQS